MRGAARSLGRRERDPRGADGEPVHPDHEPFGWRRDAGVQRGLLRCREVEHVGLCRRPTRPLRPGPRPLGRDAVRGHLQRRGVVHRDLRHRRPDQDLAAALQDVLGALARLPDARLLVVPRRGRRQRVRGQLRVRRLVHRGRLQGGQPPGPGLDRSARRRVRDHLLDVAQRLGVHLRPCGRPQRRRRPPRGRGAPRRDRDHRESRPT